MNKDARKNLIIILLIVLVLLAVTLINQYYFNNRFDDYSEYYKNELSKKISDNDLSNIDYEYLNNDINKVDDILKEQLSLDMDMLRKTRYYLQAEKIYEQKINEIVRILNDKLDDEDFYRLELDLDDFQKNIDFAISDIKNTLDSSVDIEFYINKYMYEEKQKKCRELLEMYKGFLQ